MLQFLPRLRDVIPVSAATRAQQRRRFAWSGLTQLGAMPVGVHHKPGWVACAACDGHIGSVAEHAVDHRSSQSSDGTEKPPRRDPIEVDEQEIRFVAQRAQTQTALPRVSGGPL